MWFLYHNHFAFALNTAVLAINLFGCGPSSELLFTDALDNSSRAFLYSLQLKEKEQEKFSDRSHNTCPKIQFRDRKQIHSRKPPPCFFLTARINSLMTDTALDFSCGIKSPLVTPSSEI